MRANRPPPGGVRVSHDEATLGQSPARARRTSEEAVRRATGRGWDEWCAVLDAGGADGHGHGEIARG